MVRVVQLRGDERLISQDLHETDRHVFLSKVFLFFINKKPGHSKAPGRI